MQIRQLYSQHEKEDYFPRIVDAMTSGPCTFFVAYGDPVKFRDMALKIREKYADPSEKNAAFNVIHSSEPGHAEREIAICFGM